MFVQLPDARAGQRHVLGVHVVERHQDLGAVEATAFFVKRPHFLEPVEELAAFAKLEGKIFAQQRPARCTST